MKIIKICFLIAVVALMTSCASGYKKIKPQSISYVSTNVSDNVKLEYKYNLLHKKYEKKEMKKGVKLVAVSVTNNSDQDLIFGKDALLIFEDGTKVPVVENDKVFTTLKQSPLTYLFYLLLTPLNFYTTETNSYGIQEQTSSTPIGLVIGPGLAIGNMIAAGSANSNFKKELMDYDLNGTLIKKGETKHGLIGIRTESFEALTLKVNPISETESKKEIAP